MSKINVKSVKDSIDIVDVIKEYTELEKTGKGTYKCSCPFPNHEDKTPSFHIDNNKGLYHCFSKCGGGDVITFIEEMEDLDFIDAVKLLIEDGGINYEEVLTKEYRIVDDFDITKIKKLIDLYNSNNYINEGILDKYKCIPKYMVNKGFNEDVLREFEIGFCGDVNDDLYNRVTIPWRDIDNKLVAINGRDITNESDKKYKFKKKSNKKNIIYNLNKLERNDKPIVICESEFDVIKLYQLGYKRAVALGGTSLKDKKWLLRRYTDKVILATDNDKAGMEARKEMVNQIYHLMDIYALKIPKDKDICDLDKNRIYKLFENKVKYRGGK